MVFNGWIAIRIFRLSRTYSNALIVSWPKEVIEDIDPLYIILVTHSVNLWFTKIYIGNSSLTRKIKGKLLLFDVAVLYECIKVQRTSFSHIFLHRITLVKSFVAWQAKDTIDWLFDPSLIQNTEIFKIRYAHIGGYANYILEFNSLQSSRTINTLWNHFANLSTQFRVESISFAVSTLVTLYYKPVRPCVEN